MRHTQKGGAALEYLLVSTFAAIVALALLALVGTLAKQQLTKLTEHANIDIDLPEFSFFSE